MRYLIFFFLLLFKTAIPQEAMVPLEIQYPLLLKIITFDKEFNKRYKDDIVIGILYQGDVRNSLNKKNELIRIIKENEFLVDGKKVVYELLDLSRGKPDDIISRSSANIIYVLPLTGIQIKDITVITKNRKLLSYTGVPGFIEEGIAVGIEAKDGKPSIVINMATAKLEGTEFTSQLLKLSRIVNN